MSTLLHAGAKLNDITPHFKTPLAIAAACLQVEAVDGLIKLGADVNKAYDQMEHPLYVAIINVNIQTNEINSDNAEVVRLLVKAGSRHDMALHLAIHRGHYETLKVLVNSGQFNLEQLDEEKITPLFQGMKKRRYDMVEFLIKAGANTNAVAGDKGVTPLFLLAAFGDDTQESINLGKLLIHHGANLYYKNHEGMDIMEFLSYAKVNFPNDYVEKPIFMEWLKKAILKAEEEKKMSLLFGMRDNADADSALYRGYRSASGQGAFVSIFFNHVLPFAAISSDGNKEAPRPSL